MMGRGFPAFNALTADGNALFTSSVSNSGIAMSNSASSAAAPPPTAQARSRALCAAPRDGQSRRSRDQGLRNATLIFRISGGSSGEMTATIQLAPQIN